MRNFDDWKVTKIDPAKDHYDCVVVHKATGTKCNIKYAHATAEFLYSPEPVEVLAEMWRQMYIADTSDEAEAASRAVYRFQEIKKTADKLRAAVGVEAFDAFLS